jgi:filamentous hemagglutinin family protein
VEKNNYLTVGRETIKEAQQRVSFGSGHNSTLYGYKMKTPKTLLGWFVAFTCLFIPSLALANPVGESVVAGSASFDRSAPGILNIHQGTDRAIINWQDFSIGANDLTRFLQPGVNSAVLNRVLSGNPSAIYGTLQANGQVFLLNEAGILVGASGQINTHGFLASTLNISDDSFLNNTKLTLSGDSAASIKNLGNIEALGGNVFLVARTIDNAGTISAPNGTVGLGAGTEVILGDDRGGIAVVYGAGASVNNSGLIQAAGVDLKAAGGNVYALAINNSGIVRATTVANEGGKIVLKAESGTTLSSGTLDASGSKGGEVQVLGDRVGLTGNAVVDVSGVNGGGTALIGGDFQGKNASVKNAQRTYVGPDARITADTTGSGDGGRVIVWADDTTQFYGSISGRGGVLGGNGGFAEVSGREHLDFLGGVDMRAPLGEIGRLLLDPKNIIVENGANEDITDNLFTESSSSTRNFDGTQLETVLTTTSLTLQANNDIIFREGITSATGNSLTLQAGRSIIIGETGAVTLSITGTFTATANDPSGTNAQRDSGAGSFTMFAASSINTSGGNANISITVASDDTGDSAGDITLATLNAGTGHVLVQITDSSDNGLDILRASGAQSITASSAALNVAGAANTTGGIGTSGSPINITVSNVEASAKGGGVHLNASAGVNIGGATLGAITGITTTSGGNFTLTAAGAITDSELLTIAGTTTLTAGANDITLDVLANNFSGAVSIVSADDVTLVDASAIDLGASTIASSLTVTATTGNITDSGAISVGTTTSLTANGTDADIILDLNHTFTGTVSISGVDLDDVTITDLTALDIPALTLSGNLSITAAGITQGGALAITGTTTVAAGAGNNIVLSNASNNFTGAVTITSGNDVTITDAFSTLIFAASTISGNFTVTAVGAITDTGNIIANGSGKTATFATTSTANITLDNSNDFTTIAITTGNNVSITDVNAIDLGASTISGTLAVNSTGNITDSGNLVVSGVATLLPGAANNVTLDSAGNDFSTVTVTSATGVTLVDTSGIILGASTLTGNLNVAAAGNVTDSGALAVSGTTTISASTSGDITLDGTGAGSNFSTLAITSADDVTIVDSNGLIFGTSSLSGNLTVTTTGTITQTGAITANGTAKTASFTAGANAITLTTAGNDFTTVTFSNTGANAVQITDAAGLNVGTSSTGGDLTLIVSSGDLSDSGAMTVTGNTVLTGSTGANIILDQSHTFTGTVTLNPATGLNNVQLTDTTAIVLAAGADLTITGDLTVTSSGNITETNDLIVNGAGKTATFTTSGAGTIVLTLANNDFTKLSVNGASTVDVLDANSVDLAASTVSGAGALTIASTAGSITDSGTLTFSTTGGITLTVAAGQSIVLDSAANTFGSAITLPASVLNLTLVDNSGDLDIEAVTVTGALTLTMGAAGDNITDSGAIIVTGTTTLTSSGAGNTITLDNAANNFSTVVITSVDDVNLVDTDGIILGATTITAGSLDINAGGTITDSGTIIVNGAGEVADFSTAGFVITLDSAANDFTTIRVANTGANTVTIVDVDDLDIGTSNVAAGNLTVTAGGDITDSNTVTVGLDASFTTTGSNADINLNTLAVAASTSNITLSTTGATGNATIVNTVGIDFAASSIGGNLTATATSGTIDDTGIVTVGGNATFTTSTAAQAITLNLLAVTGSISVNTTGAGAATIVNATALDLATSTLGAGGNLSATATLGNITDSGTVTVPGTATFVTSQAGADIDLGTLAVTGAIAVTTTQSAAGAKDGNATLVNSIATDLAASTVQGDLSVTVSAGATLTDSGTVTVTGDASFTTSAAGADITVNQLAVTGSVSVNTTAANGDATIVNATALTLGTSTVNGVLAATATLGSITGHNPLIVTGTATFTTTAAGQDTVLDSSANNFSSTVTVNGTTPANVTLRDSTAIALGALTLTGNLTVTAGGNITETGALVVPGTSTFTTSSGNVTLSTSTHNFSGGTVVINSAGTAAVTTGANAIQFGASTIASTLAVTSSGGITQTAALTIGGTTTIVAGAGNVTLSDSQNDFATVAVTTGATVALRDKNAIDIGTTGVTSLSITSGGAITDSGVITLTGTLTLNSGSTQDVTLDAGNDFPTVVITNGRNVTLSTTTPIIFGGASSTLTGNLNVTTSNDAITQSGEILMTGASAVATFNTGTGAITLTDVANNFKTVVVTAAGVTQLTDANSIILGGITLTANDNLTVITLAGGMTDTGATTLTGTSDASFQATSGDIVLDQLAIVNQAANVTLTTTTSGSATVVNTVGVQLGASTIAAAGNLSVTATTGNIVDNANAITVPGNATFTTLNSNDDITLTGLAVTGSTSVNTVGATGNATISDTAGLALGASNVGGNLSATAVTSITQSGAVVVGGTTTFVIGGGGSITLNNSGNNFVGAVTLPTTIATLNITDTTPLQLDAGAAMTVTTLTVSAPGITQSANGISPTTATLVATSGFDITLNDAANNFGAVSITSAKDVTLRDSGAIDIGASTISGNFTVTAAGAVTDSGILVVSGVTTISNAGNTVTLDGVGAGSNFATLAATGSTITIIDSNALILGTTTASAALSVTTSGAITQVGALSVGTTTTLAAGAANDITLDNVANVFTGDVTITTGDDVSITDTGAIAFGASTISGNFTVTANGAITDTAAISANGASKTATFAAGSANNITLDASNFRTVVITSGNNVALTDSDTIDLGASTITGTLTVTAGAGGNITDSGTVTVGGVASFITSGGGDIDLGTLAVAAAANNITLTTAGANGNAAIVNSVAIDFGVSSITGTLSATATTGNITDGGSGVTVTGTASFTTSATDADITLSGLTTTGAISLATTGTGGDATIVEASSPILGTVTIGGNLDVTGTTGGITDTGTLTVTGNSSFTNTQAANDIVLNSTGNTFTGTVDFNGTLANVTVVDTTAFDVHSSGLTTTAALSITAGGAVTQSGILTVGTTTTISASGQNVTLSNVANDFTGAVLVTGANVTLVDAGAIVLGTSTVSGTYDVTATAGGGITDTGNLAITSAASFTVAGGQSITLDNTGHVFSSTVDFNASSGVIANLTFVDTTAVDIHTSGIVLSGNLTLTAGGAVTQTGTLDIDGTTTISASGAAVTLNNSANDFTGAVAVTGAAVALRDLNGIVLGTTVATGTYAVTAAGDITQSGVTTLTITGTTALTAPGQDIILGNSNNFTGAVTITDAAVDADDVTLKDINAIVLAASAMNGNLTINTATGNGAITQTGTISVGGVTTIVAGTGNVTLTLANTLNELVITSANNVTLLNTGAIKLGSSANAGADVSNVGGTLTVEVTTGDITDVTGDELNVTGTSLFTAQATAANIVLDESANTFTGAVTFTGGTVEDLASVSIRDTSALDIAAITLSGNLTVNAAGITDSGAITVTGTTSLTSTGAANDILINNSGHTFTGAVSITSAGNATLVSDSAVDLASVSVTTAAKSLSITTSNDNITDSGTILVNGSAASTATFVAGTGDITLNSAANDFSTIAITSANNVVLVDVNALNLGASTIAGTLDVTATSLTDSGNIAVTGTSAFTVSGDVVLNSSGSVYTGAVSFAGGPDNVTIVTGAALNLAALSTGTLTVTAAGITDSGNIVTTGAATFTSTGGANDIVLDQAGNSFGAAVVLTSAHDATIVDSTALDLGTAAVTGNLTATSSAAAGITDSGTITVGGNAVFTASADGADIDLGTLAVTGTVTVNTTSSADTGNVSLGGAASLTIATASVIDGSLTVAITGTGNRLRLAAGTLTTSGTQSYTGPIVLLGDAVLVSNGAGASGNITFNSTATLNGTTANTESLTVNSSGTSTFNSVVGATIPLEAIITDAGTAGGTSLNASSMKANSFDFNDAITLTGNTALTGTGTTPSVDFASTVDGAFDLVINATTVGFHGAIGGTTDLAKLQTTLLTGTTTLSTGTVEAAIINFGDSVILTQPTTTMVATTSARFEGIEGTTVNTEALVITSPGATILSGDIGNTTKLLSLTTDFVAADTTQLDNGIIKATTVTFNDPVVLSSDVAITGTTVDFVRALTASVASLRTLTVNASGLTKFESTVGTALVPLGGLTTDADAGAADSTELSGNVFSANQTYKDNVTMKAALDLRGGSITFEKTLNTDGGAYALTVTLNNNASSVVRFLGTVGTSNASANRPDSLTVNAFGATSVKANIFTVTSETFGNDVIVGANATVDSGAITFSKTINADLAANQRTLTVTSAGAKTFTGKIGAGVDGLANTTDDGTLGTLTINGGGAITVSGGIVNAVTQTFTDALTLGANLVTYGTTGSYSTITGAGKNLTFSLGGVTSLTGAISGVADLTSNNEGSTAISGAAASITTTGKQVFTDAVTLAASTTLTATDITLAAVSGAFDLTLTGSGTTTLGGAFTSVVNLISNGGGSTLITTTSLSTDGDQTYTDAVKLGGNVALTATGGNDVIFSSTVNSDLATSLRTLSVTSSGITRFTGIVGATAKLSSLTTDSAGTVEINANVTADTQTYNDAATIGAASVLLKARPTVAANGDITFGSTLNADAANRALTIDASDVTTFTGTVGGVTALSSLTSANATGSTTKFATGAITATTQNYRNAVTLENSATTVTGTTITFGTTLAGDDTANTLSIVSGGATTFTGAVSSFASITTDATGSTLIKGNVTATTQTYNDTVKIANTPTLTGTTVSFAGTLVGNAAGTGELTISSPTVTFTGAVGTVQLKKLEVTATTALNINGGTVKATTQIYHDDVTLGAATTMTGSAVTFDRAVNGTSLTVNASGQTEFKGEVGGGSGLASLTTDAAGTTKFSSSGIVTTTGAQTYNDKVALNVDTVLNGTAITFGNTLNSFDATLRDLTVNASGVTSFNAAVGNLFKLDNLVTDASGSVALKGPTITVDDTVTFNEAVSLTGNVVLKSDIATFKAAVDGSTLNTRTLSVGAVTETDFEASIGNTTGLSTFSTLSTGIYTGPTRIEGTVLKALTQTYASPMTLAANATLTGTTVTFSGALNADVAAAFRQLTVNASGITTFGTVGNTEALGLLTTDAAGSTKLGGGLGTVTATTITFNDAVTLTGGVGTTLNATAVTFAGTVNGTASNTQTLTVNASDETVFTRTVGATVALSSLTTDAAGTTKLAGNVTAQTQTYGDDVILTGNVILSGTTLASANVTFSDTLNGDVSNTRALTINGNDVTFTGTVGADKALLSLRTDTGAVNGTTTISGGSVVATTQVYNDSLALTANTTLTGTDITLFTTAGGTHNLTLSATGNTRLTGDITGVVDLLSNNGGTTYFGKTGGSTVNITTTGTQTYSDAVTLLQDANLTGSITPTITGTITGSTLFSTPAGTKVLTLSP